MSRNVTDMIRYQRQMAFAPLGPAGQKRLRNAGVLVVGVGGLGSWAAELLARAGVGFLRLVDDDKVDLTNLHRQAMYDESDAADETPKARAAARHLKRINSAVKTDPVVARLDKDNIETLADGVELILDGTDSFASRFVINDFSVKSCMPWVFAGVVGAEAQTMAFVPPGGPCLRCLCNSPPPPCVDPTCRSAGVLGPAVATIASIQATEAIKILAGAADRLSPYLLKLDLWENTLGRIDAAEACKNVDCPCCKQKHFEFLEP